jgi:hypothetical protein
MAVSSVGSYQTCWLYAAGHIPGRWRVAALHAIPSQAHRQQFLTHTMNQASTLLWLTCCLAAVAADQGPGAFASRQRRCSSPGGPQAAARRLGTPLHRPSSCGCTHAACVVPSTATAAAACSCCCCCGGEAQCECLSEGMGSLEVKGAALDVHAQLLQDPGHRERRRKGGGGG